MGLSVLKTESRVDRYDNVCLKRFVVKHTGQRCLNHHEGLVAIDSGGREKLFLLLCSLSQCLVDELFPAASQNLGSEQYFLCKRALVSKRQSGQRREHFAVLARHFSSVGSESVNSRNRHHKKWVNSENSFLEQRECCEAIRVEPYCPHCLREDKPRILLFQPLVPYRARGRNRFAI